MENWQYELDRARSEGERAGYKIGVTEGYANGMKDALKLQNSEVFQEAVRIGYLTHQHDLLDILERYAFISREKILEELEAIHAVREASKVYTHSKGTEGQQGA